MKEVEARVMKFKQGLSVTLLTVLVLVGLPEISYASLTGCPNTWNMKVELRPSGLLKPIRGEDAEVADYSVMFMESTGLLDEAKKQFGKNIAYKFYAEWSQDGVRWYDVLAKTIDSRGYFTNSFEAQPGLFVHLDQLFRYFQAGKWRMTLEVETSDCPKEIGKFSSAPLSLNFSIVNDKRYDLKQLYESKTDLNFKYVETFIKDFDEWKSKTLSDLNTSGRSRNTDLPSVPQLVVASGGNPPCMNYVNRTWQATSTDCTLEIYFVHRINGNVEYYLVDAIEIKYASLIKAEAEANAKAKAEGDAKGTASEKEKELALAKEYEEAKAKAKAESLAKARADALAKWSSTKTTILCVKGKKTIKITGDGVKCPKGYVKK